MKGVEITYWNEDINSYEPPADEPVIETETYEEDILSSVVTTLEVSAPVQEAPTGNNKSDETYELS